MLSEWNEVRSLSARIADFTEFLRAFRNKIQPDGTLEDKASPELARIRREIELDRTGARFAHSGEKADEREVDPADARPKVVPSGAAAERNSGLRSTAAAAAMSLARWEVRSGVASGTVSASRS